MVVEAAPEDKREVPGACAEKRSSHNIWQWKSVRTSSVRPDEMEGGWKPRHHMQTRLLTPGSPVEGWQLKRYQRHNKRVVWLLVQGWRDSSYCPCLKPAACVAYKSVPSFLNWRSTKGPNLRQHWSGKTHMCAPPRWCPGSPPGPPRAPLMGILSEPGQQPCSTSCRSILKHQTVPSCLGNFWWWAMGHDLGCSIIFAALRNLRAWGEGRVAGWGVLRVFCKVVAGQALAQELNLH